MQEVDTNVLQFSIYFTYVSVSDPMYGQEISASRFVEVCLGLVVSENNLTSHTPYFLKTSLTNFFSTPLAVDTRHFSCIAVTNWDWPQASQIADPEKNI